jgi:hypothetical protein
MRASTGTSMAESQPWSPEALVEICHGLHRIRVPQVVIGIKVPGCLLLDTHLAAERMLDPFLE